MSSFFDKSLFQQIASGLVVLLISIWLGGKTTQAVGKGWKIAIIFSWIMTLGGLYIFGANYPHGTINDPYVGMGLSLFFLGLLVNRIGKFFDWWHH